MRERVIGVAAGLAWLLAACAVAHSLEPANAPDRTDSADSNYYYFYPGGNGPSRFNLWAAPPKSELLRPAKQRETSNPAWQAEDRFPPLLADDAIGSTTHEFGSFAESALLGLYDDAEISEASHGQRLAAAATPLDNLAASPQTPGNGDATPYGLALRGGWWDVSQEGAPTKIGEWQSLESAAFWDADGLWTNGRRTLDFTVTGLDSEATDSRFRYYGPRASGDVEYQRFFRRTDHDPIQGITDSQEQPPGGVIVTKEDLNAGADYAIRVQELKADFDGQVMENLKWRLGIWGMRKTGDRQVNAMAHCFNHPTDTDVNGNPVFGVACHVLTQRQRIDWITTEIEPGLEATVGPATIEYRRTMRAFDQQDEIVRRDYNNFGFGEDLAYAVVPENFTEIDRIQSNLLLTDHWDVYSSAYTGNTKNKTRDVNRRLWGFDVRSTIRKGSAASLTGFARKNVQTGQLPPFLLPEESLAGIRAPVNYDQTVAGLRGRWRPFASQPSYGRGLRLSGGYEYRGLARENAVYAESAVTASQSHTTANLAHARAAMRWNSQFESTARYRFGFIDDPIFGLAKNGTTNSSLPTQQHLVELGGVWTPTDNFMLTGTFGFENRWNTSEVSNFQEDDYPIVLTAWYAPTTRWTFSGGLAFFSSWIDQDVTLGALTDTITTRWNYRGRSDVVNLGTTFAWTPRLTLSGGFEYVHGNNRFANPALPYDLSEFSEVLVETTRWTAGLDYQLSAHTDVYVRYQFFDYDDKSQEFNSGTASMILAGVGAIF